jgi:uncharacterized protein YndB with AHSA1/START domain
MGERYGNRIKIFYETKRFHIFDTPKSLYMKAEPFIIERVFDAPVEMIWRALTDKNEMKKWYFDLEEFKAQPGFEFSFTGGKDDVEYLHLCKVIDVVPKKKLSYTWKYEGYTGESKVIFELFPEGNKTRLKLTHEGLETFAAATNPDFDKKNFAQGWTDIIGRSLAEYLVKSTKTANL